MIRAPQTCRHDDAVGFHLLQNAVGPLGHGKSCPGDDGLRQAQLHVLCHIPQVIIQTAHLLHHNAQRRLDAVGNGLLLAPLIGLRHCDGLGHGDIDGGADGDALFRQMLNDLHTGGRSRQLDRDIGRPGVHPAALGQHALGITGAAGIELAQRVAVGAVGGVVNVADLISRISCHQLQKCLGMCLGGGEIIPQGQDLGRPEVRLRSKGAEREHGIGGHTRSAALERQINFCGVSGIMPPAGGGALIDPFQIIHRSLLQS